MPLDPQNIDEARDMALAKSIKEIADIIKELGVTLEQRRTLIQIQDRLEIYFFGD